MHSARTRKQKCLRSSIISQCCTRNHNSATRHRSSQDTRTRFRSRRAQFYAPARLTSRTARITPRMPCSSFLHGGTMKRGVPGVRRVSTSSNALLVMLCVSGGGDKNDTVKCSVASRAYTSEDQLSESRGVGIDVGGVFVYKVGESDWARWRIYGW